jgi:hypothetical protein
MQMPLLTPDEEHAELVRRYYPGVDARFVDSTQFTPDYLFTHFDLLFRSDIWDMKQIWERLKPLEAHYGKRLRCVHCPHGFSDKTYWFTQCIHDDITMVYGQNMLEQLEHEGVREDLHRFVLSGNYRWTYYEEHRNFLDQRVEKDVFSKFEKQQPTVLYAPTWVDTEDSSSFFDAFAHLLEDFPDELNLLVKLHPHLEDYEAARLYPLLGRYEDQGNVVFLERYPLVYPLLARSDLYLGDTSSVGYDYLAFRRPMLFLNQKALSLDSRQAYLFRCGKVLPPSEYAAIVPQIKELLEQGNPYAEEQERVYRYTFGPTRPFSEVRKALLAAYHQPVCS